MNRKSWGAICGLAICVAAASARAAAPVEGEAPAQCEWRQPDRSTAPLLYCAEDGKMIFTLSPRGFDPQTIPKAKAGDPAAMTALAVFYLQGPKALRDAPAALDLLRRAAAAGRPQAMFDLCLAYARGDGVARDGAEAVRWCRAASAMGDASATNNLISLLIARPPSGEGDAEALKLARAEADEGRVEGLLHLGLLYGDGRGVTRDDVEALRWFRLAADRGNTDAMYRVGVAYAEGLGVARDDDEADAWIGKSEEPSSKAARSILLLDLMVALPSSAAGLQIQAEAGDPRAMLDLAVAYDEGRFVRKDPKQAARWFRAAAERGAPLGMTETSRLYASGIGVEKDEGLARRWLRAGAAASHRARYPYFDSYQSGVTAK